MRTLREHMEQTYAALDRERSSWRQHWLDLQQFILPRRGRFFTTDVNKGNRRNKSIIDSTGTMAARNLGSGMMAGITSPARPWFRLAPPDPGMRDFAPVRNWLDIVERLLREIFARSNVYNVLHMQYKELGTFGTGPILVQEDFDDVIRAYPFTVGSYMLGTDERLRVNTVYRDVPMTVEQVVRQFGLSKVTNATRELYEKGDYHVWVDVVHAIEPNDDELADQYMSRLDGRQMEFRSVYYEKGSDSDKFLSVSGYYEFPVMAPRWDVLGTDVYGGSCPGMDALGDCQQLQVMQREKGKGIAKQVNPPMVASPTLKDRATSTLPGGVTFVDAVGGKPGFYPAYQVQFDLRSLQQDIYETQQRIRRAFYEDLFLMLAQSDRREMTAREVEERHEEKLLMLGPVMERLNDELLGPLIDRTFMTAIRAGIVPEPPKEIQGAELQVEYISIMAQAQKMIGVTGVDRLVGFVGGLAQVKPEVIDKLDVDQAVDEYADMLGTPASLVLSDEQVAEQRKQRQQAEQQQQQLNMAQQAADTLSRASQAKAQDGKSIVDAMLGSVPGA